jgi:type IV pilus assembly protein PilQ
MSRLVSVKDRTIITAAFHRPGNVVELQIKNSGKKMHSTRWNGQQDQTTGHKAPSVSASIMRGETMAMIAKRLVVSLMLLALVSNVSVFASVNAGVRAESFALVSLKHENEGSLTRILIESSAPPLYTVLRPSDRLIVVDLPGGEASRLDQAYSVKSAVVDSITVKQSQMSAGAVSRSSARIEISVRADARDRTTVNGNTLVLEVTPDLKPAPAKAVVEKDATANAKDARRVQAHSDTHAAVSGVMVYPTPIKNSVVKPEPAGAAEKTKTSPIDLKPATLIRAVHSEAAGDAVRIVVSADGTTQYKAFVLPNPWRIVVDITGVRSAFGNKATTVGNGQVERFRVGQPAPNVVRIVLDTKSKVPYNVVRDGENLVITIGDASAFQTKANSDAKALQNASSVKDAEQRKPEVRVAGDRVENKSDNGKQADQSAKQAVDTSNLLAQANRGRVTPQPNRALPLPTQPAPTSSEAKSAAMPATQPAVNRSVSDVARPGSNSGAQSGKRSDLAFCDPAYVGGLISFDLRAGVDIRDMLRFISQQYGVNFIVDKSVSAVPVDIRVTDIPWNHVMESVLKANRLGAVCESNGRMIRIATLAAVKEEEDQQLAIREAQSNQVPLTTKIIHLKYARAAGQLAGRGSSGGSGGSSSSSSGGMGGASGVGSLRSIVESRLSKRGRVEVDIRTNSLIVTDLPEYMQVVEEMIAKLDRPEPQVEIEARIVIANRNFLRDIGTELAGAAVGANGRGGLFETTPVQVVNGSLQPGGPNGGSGGSGGGSGSGAGGAGGSGSGSNQSKGLGPNLIGPFADTALRAGVANTVLSLTTGAIGTGLLSMALSAQETKGQIRTIASPRVTTTDNKTAEIVNGVQIPVQTVSNNTITTTFVTAALRLEITPQIVEENGQVLMHVVAENNTVNFALAGQFNNGTPGINTQSAESTVLIQDGGTTILGGINIDTEGHLINRTAGISNIPLLGELFKKRQTRRETDEILFFVTPRIVRTDGTVGPRVPQRSSVEGQPNPAATQSAATAPAVQDKKQDKKKDSKPAASAPASGVSAAAGKAGK